MSASTDASVLLVGGRHSDAPAAKVLNDGDIILKIDGCAFVILVFMWFRLAVSCFRDVEECTMHKPEVEVKVSPFICRAIVELHCRCCVLDKS